VRVRQRHPPYYGSFASQRHSEFALECPIENQYGQTRLKPHDAARCGCVIRARLLARSETTLPRQPRPR
jgi:hypothetical protein